MHKELAAEIKIIVNGDDFKVISWVHFRREMRSKRHCASLRDVVLHYNLCSNRRCSAVELYCANRTSEF